MKFNRIFSLLFLVAILLMVFPVIAQDETPAVTDEPTLVPTAVPEPTLVVTPAPEPTPAPESGFDLREFLIGALVGTATTLAAVFGMVGRLKNDVAALNAIEWLGKSIPVEALDKLNHLGQSLRDAGEVLDKVTDGKPNVVNDAGS